MSQSPTNNIPLKSDLTRKGTTAWGSVYEVDGDPGTLCYISRQDGREYGITHDALPSSCVEIDISDCAYGRSVSIQGGAARTPAATVYEFADEASIEQLNTDLAALYDDFESAVVEGDTLKITTTVGSIAGPVSIDCLTLYCARLGRDGNPDSVQIEVDSVDGADLDTTSFTTEAEYLAEIQSEYPELNVLDFYEDTDGTHGDIWVLAYLTDGVSDVVTEVALDATDELIENLPCSQVVPPPPPEGLGSIPEVNIDGTPRNTLAEIRLVIDPSGNFLEIVPSAGNGDPFTP